MRIPVRIVACVTTLAAVVVLTVWSAGVPSPLPVESLTAGLPVSIPAERVPTPTWIDRARHSLDGMGLPIRGQRLDTLLATVDHAASQFEVDPVTVLAVILVESRFDPRAVSPRGAMGLMQLRAETARELAGQLGVNWTSDDLLLDPDVNVLLGTYYLSQLIQRFGDPDAAFAAFHSGPGRIAALGGPPPRAYADLVWDAVVRLRLRPIA